MATVDIGMPTRVGGSPWIRPAVDSILAQTFQDWQLTISENGAASDELARAVAPYLDDSRVALVATGRDLGAAGNHNRVVASGTAPYVAILHDDDLWAPEFLERRVEFLEANPDCGLVFGRYMTVASDARPLFASVCDLRPGRVEPEAAAASYLRQPPIGMPSLLVRRAAYDAVGPFLPDLPWMDLEMWFRIIARFPIGYLDVVDSAWRRHESQTSSTLRLWGDNHVRLLAAWEKTLEAVPELRVERRILREKQGRAALHAGLDALETGNLERARSELGEAIARHPPLRRDRRALVLAAAVSTGRVGVAVARVVRHLSWRLPTHRLPNPYARFP